MRTFCSSRTRKKLSGKREHITGISSACPGRERGHLRPKSLLCHFFAGFLALSTVSPVFLFLPFLLFLRLGTLFELSSFDYVVPPFLRHCFKDLLSLASLKVGADSEHSRTEFVYA